MLKKILHVATNVDHFGDSDHPTGLWLSELSHAWDVFEKHGYEQTIISPKGGKVPLEPQSLTSTNMDSDAKAWKESRADLLDRTVDAASVNPVDFDAIYFTGGHAVMYDFLDSEPLKNLTAAMWEHGKIVSSVCHGFCGLLNVKIGNKYMINGRKLTGFSWAEEEVAGAAKMVPYDAEKLSKERGALYEKASKPFASYTVVDGNLVTGQNPGSAKETAEKVVELLEKA